MNQEETNVIHIYRTSWTCECGGKWFKLVKEENEEGLLVCQTCNHSITGVSIQFDFGSPPIKTVK